MACQLDIITLTPIDLSYTTQAPTDTTIPESVKSPNSTEKVRPRVLLTPSKSAKLRRTRTFRKQNTLLLDAVRHRDVNQIGSLIQEGANPNATYILSYVSACHLAAFRTDDALAVLINHGAEKCRWDRHGRTPLHLAAWAGHVRQIAALLGLPKDLQEKVDVDYMSAETEEEVKRLSQNDKSLVTARCDCSKAEMILPREWQDDNREFHKSKRSQPCVQPGQTALHVACELAWPRCVRLLLAAGAEGRATDNNGMTALDVAGSLPPVYIHMNEKSFQDPNCKEALHMSVNVRYFRQIETWVKLSSICIAVILPYSIAMMTLTGSQWPRHLATAVLLLAWLEMMFLFARFPNWGYYVLMFAKVSANVMKILLTFAFLVIGFSFSFMEQFRAQPPFENSWAAFVKTMAMMTSEFDYEGLVDKDYKQFVTSLIVVRLIYLIFLIFAAIVLMNLMVGVAVNDLHNLTLLGNVRRLAKQVEFLSSLEKRVYNKVFKKILSDKLIFYLRQKKTVPKSIELCPSEPKLKYNKVLPSHIREGIFVRAQRKNLIDKSNFQINEQRLVDIHNAVLKIGDNVNSGTVRKDKEEVLKELNNVKNQLNLSVAEVKSSIEGLNVKFDMILNKLDESFSP